MHRPFNKFRQRIGAIVRRQNYSSVSSLTPELEKAFNDQINNEFFASFSYLSMAVHFGRQDVCYTGCYKYFLHQSQEEQEHAQKFIAYLLKRGSKVALKAIEPPTTQCWDSPVEAFKDALKLESLITKKLFDLRKYSEEKGDLCSSLLIENEFLDDQIEEYDKLSRSVAQLEKIGDDATGIYVFDKYLLKENK